MKKYIFIIVLMVCVCYMYAQASTATTAYKSSAGEVATITSTQSGTVMVGTVKFQVGNQEWTFTSQGNLNMTIQPFRIIHIDFVSSDGYRARNFLQDSPRNNQLDITLPTGRTITYHYDRELTNQIGSFQYVTPSGSAPTNNSGGSSNTPQSRSPVDLYCALCSIPYSGNGECKPCNGTGYITSPYGSGYLACPNCWSGRRGACSSCRGTGRK